MFHRVFFRHPCRIVAKNHTVLLSTHSQRLLLAQEIKKTLPCFLSDRHSVAFFTGALNPFAVEHPTHGSSSTPGLSLLPCCLADSLSRRGWGWAVVRWCWLISTSVVGRSLGAIAARACSMSSPSTLRPYEMYMSLITGQSRSSPDLKCTASPGSSPAYLWSALKIFAT